MKSIFNKEGKDKLSLDGETYIFDGHSCYVPAGYGISIHKSFIIAKCVGRACFTWSFYLPMLWPANGRSIMIFWDCEAPTKTSWMYHEENQSMCNMLKVLNCFLSI